MQLSFPIRSTLSIAKKIGSFSHSFYTTSIMVNYFVCYSISCICHAVYPVKKNLSTNSYDTFGVCIPVDLNSTEVKLLAPVVRQIIYRFLSKTSTFDLYVNSSSFSTWVTEEEGLPAFRLTTDGWPVSIESRHRFFARSILALFAMSA